ncbi:MAG: T9SS type A sorting domain-containing protein [Bacteroidetes bacterium]|nr:T9SS type A sorting domain-containing protein [Bacteroidota bacterium]
MKKILTLFVALLLSSWAHAQITGNSLRLNANANYVTVPDAASASLSNDMTWEFWIYYRCVNGNTAVYPLTKGWCGSTWSYYVEIQNGQLNFQKINPGGSGTCPNAPLARYESTPGLIPFNTWTHISIVQNGTNVQFYTNGQAATTTLTAGSVFTGIHTSPRPFIIGAYQNLGGSFVGVPQSNMDEVRIWHTARTQEEIQNNMLQELIGNEGGLYAYWKLNETGAGAGITVANSAIATGATTNGTTVGTAPNILFVDNSNVQNQLPNCDPILWLKADAGITLNGLNEVTQWADQSGNNNHAIADGTTLPTVIPNALNNKPVVDFTDDRLATPLVNLTTTNQTEVFVVYKGIGANGFTPMEFSDDGNVVTTGFYIADQDNSCPGCQNDVSAGLKGNTGYNQNTLNQTQGCAKIINATFDKSLASEEVKIWLNGVLQPKTPGTTDANNTNNYGSHKFYLGKRSANCTFCPGVMGEFYYAEIIVYNRVLSPSEKTQINTYLQNKYFSGTAASFVNVPAMPKFNDAVYDDNVWKHSYNTASPNEVIASVKDNCLALGTRNDTVYVAPNAGIYNGQPYMRRHYVIHTSLNPVGTKKVRLYYTDADFADLQTLLPSLTNHNQLVVTKYNGANEDGIYNPAGGTLTLIPSGQITTGTAFGQRYLQFDVSGFSEFWIHTGNTPLPLDLLSFTATKRNNEAQLSWKIANMQQVAGFEIEKSTDALSFSNIGFVRTTENNDYNFVDNNLHENKNYYRLKILDNDGQFSFSKTVLVLNSDKMHVDLYPNPVKEELQINTTTQTFKYEIYDIYGKKVLSGMNESAHAIISCKAFHKGLYFIKVDADDEIVLLKFVKE